MYFVWKTHRIITDLNLVKVIKNFLHHFVKTFQGHIFLKGINH